jgi:hypothetical protein
VGQRDLQRAPDRQQLVSEMPALRSSTTLKSALGVGLLLICLTVTGGSFHTTTQQPRAVTATRSQPEVVALALDAAASPVVFSYAVTARDALGFPVGVRRSGKHVQDKFQHVEYDEVDELDAAGRPISMTQLDASGHLRVAVRLDDSPHPATPIARDPAIEIAQRGAISTGLTVAGPTHVDKDAATDDWTVRWSRTQNGIEVRGDETRVQVRPDGHIQSLARVEHELAAEPTQRINADRAKEIVSRQAEDWFAAAGSGYTIEKMDVQWVGPNGAFDASKPIDPQPVYRLAWVANVKPSGDASSYLWMVTVFVDAGDGSLLGGDFVE